MSLDGSNEHASERSPRGMRILFVCKDYFPALGGMQEWTHDLAIRLLARGHEVAVLAWKRSRSPSGLVDRAARKVRGSVPLHEDRALGYPTLRSILPQEAFSEVVSTHRPDVVVVNGSGAHTLAFCRALLADGGQPAKVLYIHDVAAVSLLEEPAIRLGAVVGVSRFIAGEARKRGWEASHLPSIFDPGRYRVDTSREVVLFVNPVPQKGVDIALGLAERRRDISFAFARCWDIRSDAERALRARVARLPNVELRPTTRDPRTLYRDARLLLVPSVYPEGWPRVISEAQLSGIPALASAIGGVPEAVGPGGILVDPTAPLEEWVEGLSRMWDDAGSYARYAAVARHHIDDPAFDPESIVGRIEEIFQGVVSERPAIEPMRTPGGAS